MSELAAADAVGYDGSSPPAGWIARDQSGSVVVAKTTLGAAGQVEDPNDLWSAYARYGSGLREAVEAAYALGGEDYAFEPVATLDEFEVIRRELDQG